MTIRATRRELAVVQLLSDTLRGLTQAGLVQFPFPRVRGKVPEGRKGASRATRQELADAQLLSHTRQGLMQVGLVRTYFPPRRGKG